LRMEKRELGEKLESLYTPAPPSILQYD
jgi:hypothetical protein